MRGARSPEPRSGGWGVSSWPMAARFSWMKSVNCCPRRRSRCCGSCRNGHSSESAARSRSPSTFASSRPRIAISRPRSANGSFRQDLFYRLNVFPIEVPPLRERRDDILMLVEYFVQRYATRAGKNIRSIDKKTLDLLQAYDWPGNIRELQNVIERSVILSSSEVFAVDESWLSTQSVPPRPRRCAVGAAQGEPRSEREIIEAALAECRGRVAGPSGAAAKLGSATVHARPSHQGVEHQQGAIQVSLKPAGITRFTTFTRFTRFTSSLIGLDRRGFAAFSVNRRWRPVCHARPATGDAR